MADIKTDSKPVILSPEGLDMKTPLTAIIDKAVIKSIKDAIGGDRKSFDSYESALETLQKGMEATNSFAGLPIISYNPDSFTEQRTVIATVQQRVKESKAADGTVIPATNGIRAILIFPQPKIETYWESEEGKAWLEKLAEREAADVGFQYVRSADSVLSLFNAVDGMSVTVETIARDSRANAADTSIFDDNWQAFKDAFVEKNQTFKEDGMFPAKPLWLKAIRSKSFAEEHPSTQALEKRGLIVKIATIFVNTLKAAIDPETKEPLNLDVSLVEGWIADREKVNLSAGAKPKEGALDGLELDF